MIRMEVFDFDSNRFTNKKTGDKQKALIEDFIAKVGYDNIKNIIVCNSSSTFVCYSIFYEDGQPYTPYVEE